MIALGFNQPSDPLEFKFDTTGGDAFTMFGSGSVSGGIILGASGFSGDWTNDFSTILASHTYTGVISAVPIPAAVWLFGSGLIGLIGIARRKTRNQYWSYNMQFSPTIVRGFVCLTVCSWPVSSG